MRKQEARKLYQLATCRPWLRAAAATRLLLSVCPPFYLDFVRAFILLVHNNVLRTMPLFLSESADSAVRRRQASSLIEDQIFL